MIVVDSYSQTFFAKIQNQWIIWISYDIHVQLHTLFWWYSLKVLTRDEDSGIYRVHWRLISNNSGVVFKSGFIEGNKSKVCLKLRMLHQFYNQFNIALSKCFVLTKTKPSHKFTSPRAIYTRICLIFFKIIPITLVLCVVKWLIHFNLCFQV